MIGDEEDVAVIGNRITADHQFRDLSQSHMARIQSEQTASENLICDRDHVALSDILIEGRRIRIWHSECAIEFPYCVQLLYPFLFERLVCTDLGLAHNRFYL